MELPNKKYNTIVIDPPWDISMSGVKKLRKNMAKNLPYKTMSLKEIKEINLGNIANIGSHIYLWTTNKFLDKAFDVLKEWNVNFHLVLVWVKPSGIAPAFGYMFATEFCLLGFYGKPMQGFLTKAKLNWFKSFNPAGKHSSKPNVFYNLIKDMSPEPRLDLFSRRVIADFDSWGDEAPTEKQQVLTKEQ